MLRYIWLHTYYSFPDSGLDNKQFALKYLENFLRHYVGFYTSQPTLIKDQPEGDTLLSRIEASRSLFPFSDRLDVMLDWYEAIEKGWAVIPQQNALEAPRTVSDTEDSTICVFLDELQNARLPQHNFDVGAPSEAWCFF